MRSARNFVPALRRWVGAGLVLLLLTACAGTTPRPANLPVTVTLNSYSLTPSATSAAAGSVTFNVTNVAASDLHEFVVAQTDLAADQLVVGDDDTVDEASVTVIDEIAEMAPGGGGTLTLDLAAGHYVLFCNVAGHQRQGMHADFTVNP